MDCSRQSHAFPPSLEVRRIHGVSLGDLPVAPHSNGDSLKESTNYRQYNSKANRKQQSCSLLHGLIYGGSLRGIPVAPRTDRAIV